MPSQKRPAAERQLETYRAKRDRGSTPEPFDRIHIPATNRLFVVQQHAASHLHFDLRLELDGVLKSWAVPKGPSDDPKDKRLAMETEDHPLDYADFEGHIPEGNYGAGYVIVWDRGTYTALEDLATGFKKGKLLFELSGSKLRGRWTLVRLKSREATGKEWLLIKEHDAYESADGPTFSHESVLSGLTVKQLENPQPKIAAIKRALKPLSAAATVTDIDKIAHAPMLATSGEASNRKGWAWELKYDGYRILARKALGSVKLFTRNGHDISQRFPEICQVLSHLPVDECIIDGELVVHDTSGRPSFALMQQRARSLSPHQVATTAITDPATYYCFDLLFVNGRDLRACTLLERKRVLRQIVPDKSAFVYSEHVLDQGLKTFQAAKEIGIEGVVGKRVSAQYTSGRSSAWVKVRVDRTGDFVVLGWSPSKSNPHDIGSLALGEYRGETLCYAGHAGSGLGQALRRQLLALDRKLARKTAPVRALPEDSRVKTTHWWTPRLVVEAGYTEYTPAGHLRHPRIHRVRDDKRPEECIGNFDGGLVDIDTPATATERVVVTNPEKTFFPQPEYTKLDLVDYYKKIAKWMLPYLIDRPIVMTRYPDGVNGKSFYQRDVPDYVPDWIKRAELWSESTDKPVNYFLLQRPDDLAYVANMGTLPIHIWHARVTDLDHADWCVLDLDPKSAPFADVITLALEIRDICEEVELPAYPKTSGASGLHVLIPLARQLDHDQSRTLGELLARVVVERHPEIATIARTVRAREGKVYVDFMQNGHGRLIVAPFAVRAEQAASISMPLKWHEVNKGLNNAKYHIGNGPARMQRLGADPMVKVLEEAPDLERSLGLLGGLLTGAST